MNHTIVCRACGWRGPDERLLVAPNPFYDPLLARPVILGCPECKEVHALIKDATDGSKSIDLNRPFLVSSNRYEP